MTNKRHFFYLLFIISIFYSNQIKAQGAESNDWTFDAGVDYFWGGKKLNFIQGTVDIGNGPLYKFSILKNLSSGTSLGFQYSVAPTSIVFEPNSSGGANYNREESPLGANFVEFKTRQNFEVSDVVTPYIDGGLGVAIYNFKSDGVKDATKFLLGFGAGAEFNVSDQFAININGGLKMPMMGGGSGIYCGIGGYSGVNCGLTFNGQSIITHWLLGGGFSYSF